MVAGVVDGILGILVSSLNLGTYDEIDSISQQFLGTSVGNPNVVGFFIVNMVAAVVLGIIFGIIIFLLLTRAG